MVWVCGRSSRARYVTRRNEPGARPTKRGRANSRRDFTVREQDDTHTKQGMDGKWNAKMDTPWWVALEKNKANGGPEAGERVTVRGERYKRLAVEM
jgi:hypothetical protein